MQRCVPIRMLLTGVLAGVGITTSNGEYILTSRRFPRATLRSEEEGVAEVLAFRVDLNGDGVTALVSRLRARLDSFTFYRQIKK